MSKTYDLKEFLQHQKLWQSDYHSLKMVSFDGLDVPVGTDQSVMAQTLRTRFMMRSEGVEPAEEGKKAAIFTLIQMFLREHVDTFLSASLVRVHDGTQAVVAPELLVSMHQAFASDPPPLPATVSVSTVIHDAKTKYFKLVHPPENT